VKTRALYQTRRAHAAPAAWQRLSAAAAAPATTTLHPTGRHPLADNAVSLSLRRRAEEIEAAFGAIEPSLRMLAPRQFEDGFAQTAAAEMRARLGLDIPADLLTARWNRPLDLSGLYGHCVLAMFTRLVARGFQRDLTALDEGEPADALMRFWGFHAVDITACADGRLAGVLDYILRVPPAIVSFRESYAGAKFEVGAAVRRWESVELRRHRLGQPNRADENTRFLKIGVYHFSSRDPRHEGCAAHGSDDARAAGDLLTRLENFQAAMRRVHGADVAVLLVGVDTDTDAIRVHVPDSAGRMTVSRFVESGAMYARTAALPRAAAKEAIREAVAASIGVAPDDRATEGMRWFCGYLLKNNIAQVDAVRDWHGGAYKDAGHTEKLLVVGDPVDEVQMRNLAFQAQMNTVEEGAADLDVGIKILSHTLVPQGLAIPVLVHVRGDSPIPGAFDLAREKALRLGAAISARYPDPGLLHVHPMVRTSATEMIEVTP
jgi:carboxysome shell carbonic anhydrase